MTAIVFALVMTTTVAFADGEATDVLMTGRSNTFAGDFVIHTTSDVFHYQGMEYEVYKVYYDDPSMNLKIAVNKEGKCKSFVAYTTDYLMFYNCTKDGFGVRKVMFTSPDAKDTFDPEAYKDQMILSKKRKIEKKRAIGLIAAFLPGMKSA
jgi:hypothetical protein